jgi:hypothetical protein
MLSEFIFHTYCFFIANGKEYNSDTARGKAMKIMKIWFDDSHDDKARGRDFQHFSFFVCNKSCGDITRHLINILDKCSRHPDYYKASKLVLIAYADTDENVKASFQEILEHPEYTSHLIPIVKEILAASNNPASQLASGSIPKSKL